MLELFAILLKTIQVWTLLLLLIPLKFLIFVIEELFQHSSKNKRLVYFKF